MNKFIHKNKPVEIMLKNGIIHYANCFLICSTNQDIFHLGKDFFSIMLY